MNVYSKRGVRHRIGGESLGDSWTVCGKWTRDMATVAPDVSVNCKRCFREEANGNG